MVVNKKIKMEDKNIKYNLLIKQMLQSDAIAYAPGYISSITDNEFGVFNKAYQDVGKIYAKLKASIQNNNCLDENCTLEHKQLLHLEQAPAKSIEFMENVVGELAVTEEDSYDVNNDYKFLVAQCIINKKPGFSKNDGYDVSLYLLGNGSQELIFTGPIFKEPFIINSNTLATLLDAGTSMVVSTPKIEILMDELLKEVGVFAPEMFDEQGKLLNIAKIKEEFILKTPDGSYDYEIIDIGNNKGRNILQYDLDKIERKVEPFMNAEIAGLLQSEQEAVALWNVYLGKETSLEEDDQMMQDANAGSIAWNYAKVLPLNQTNKNKFATHFKNYFFNNYLLQFTRNQLPVVQQDAGVFDLEEAKSAKAQKFLDDNNLN